MARSPIRARAALRDSRGCPLPRLAPASPPLPPPTTSPREPSRVLLSVASHSRRSRRARPGGVTVRQAQAGRDKRGAGVHAALPSFPAAVFDPFPPFPPLSPSPPPLPKAVEAGAAHAGGGAGRGGPRRRRRRGCRQGGGLKLNSHGLNESRELHRKEVTPWLLLREAVRYAWQ